ncbi:hypothetical protein CEXT_233281 [Caerostris extrusa]|uniref:Uncharacterized protein n=1 Tax=Caerostris extrusa TaxID=172846 RepID=A0AAV4WSP2_CAEEX|nr:hypothetical protein CEXT_233281 [Caerostris extrusa]
MIDIGAKISVEIPSAIDPTSSCNPNDICVKNDIPEKKREKKEGKLQKHQTMCVVEKCKFKERVLKEKQGKARKKNLFLWLKLLPKIVETLSTVRIMVESKKFQEST